MSTSFLVAIWMGADVTHVEIPSLAGSYRAFYNPGGPGPEPFEGIRIPSQAR